MLPRLPQPVLTATLLAWAACVPQAWAIGLAGSSGAAVIGQPLDVFVVARLDNGESLTAECVAAEVSYGEQKLPAAAVRARVESAGSGAGSANAVRIRVLTTTPIDEPVVDVLVSAGCGVRVSRRYLILAAGGAGAATNASQTVLVRPVAIGPVETQAPDGSAAAPVARQNAVDQSAATSAPRVATVATARPPASRPSTPPAPRVTGPRLRLDVSEAASDSAAASAADPPELSEGSVVEQALQAVAEAASAARAISEAASAANQKVQVLEGTVQQLKAQGQEQLAVNERLRQSFLASEAMSRWLWPLATACAVLLGLCAWLAWRLRKLQKFALGGDGGGRPSRTFEADRPPSRLLDDGAAGGSRKAAGGSQQQRASASPADTTPSQPSSLTTLPATVGFSSPEAWLPTLDTVAERTGSPQFKPAADVSESIVERTDPTLQSVQGARLALRDVSIEELIDLEQQADFFVALDQDDAAISLLSDHLRQSNGASPLSYLKLMEIYRRQGDQVEYERTQYRFNQRFNAFAPGWDTQTQSGKGLHDYPAVLPRLQRAWHKPLDSMAELEALLFKKLNGETFDLPAYREVLFLYAIARDLLDREAAGTGTVDLLLPITLNDDRTHAPTRSTIAEPHAALGAVTGANGVAGVNGSNGAAGVHDVPGVNGADGLAAELDFDLSQDPASHPSIFDPMRSSQGATRRP